MSKNRFVLVSLFVSALLLESGGCYREGVPKEGNVKPRDAISATQSANEEYDRIYLLPFLKEVGTPVACVSEFWPHAMQDECMKEPGVPFKAELPLTLAIWSDGTVIWRVPPIGPRPEYFEARVPQDTVSKLLAPLDLKEFMTPENVRYSREAISRYLPALVIMVSKGGNRLFLCSQLDSMELLQEYWVWEGSERRTFPFSTYSFDDFCKQLPEAYSRHLKEFAGLRSELRAVIPAAGRRITLHDRVLWKVVTADGDEKEK